MHFKSKLYIHLMQQNPTIFSDATKPLQTTPVFVLKPA